ncbi:MAG: histidine phosphatase family protein [Ardenticatenaceae bacterium]|nr:histidine phosphatase family protein [Ardenticatenaceae bacterium]
MNTPKLLFVRHAAVTRNPAQASHSWSLSANGRFQAAQLAPQLTAHQPTRIITSEETKAQETGQIIAQNLGLPWGTAPGLQEHDRHGAPYIARHEDFVTAVSQLFTHPNKLVFGNETAQAARERMETAVQQQLATYPNDTLIIVTHGTILTLFLCQHNPHLNPITFWQNLPLPWVGIVTLPTFSLTNTLLHK